MLIDCDDCTMRGLACGDCVVTALLGPHEQGLDEVEQSALDALAQGGLVSRLRMVPRHPSSLAASRGEAGKGRSTRAAG